MTGRSLAIGSCAFAAKLFQLEKFMAGRGGRARGAGDGVR